MATAAANPPRVRRLIARLLSAIIIVAAGGAAVAVTREYYHYPRTDDAYVRANLVGIAPHVSGPIVTLPIVDNQHVRRGEMLFVVDPRPYQAALERATANLDLTNLQIKALENAIAAAHAERSRRAADLAYNRQYLERIKPLLDQRFVTANDVFDARARVSAAEAAVDNAESEAERAQNELGQLGDINARRKAAEAALEDARLNVNYCYVRAPFDGYVTNLNIAVGQYANEGHQVVALVDNRAWYVLANFREDFIGSIKPGMTAEVFLLAYPGHRFRGRVQGVGWALYQPNGATVEGLPQVEPTLNWVRLSQRFPVRIMLDDRDPERPFRMGATAVVTIQGFRSRDDR
ncbi:MAG TPA: biotin/lipoyl-binding protein [Candidatus Binataceae bacterium]|nr:biotin/lipoyl-binding protein [Candidatus Binataceae bacterium]